MSEAFAWPLLAGGSASLARSREQARSEGYAAGLAEGRQRAADEVAALKQSLEASLRALPAVGEALGVQQSRDVTDLVLHLTRALLGVELRTNPAVVAQLVSEALSALGDSRAVLTVRVSEEDAGWLQATEGFTLEIEAGRRAGAITVIGSDLELEFDPLTRLAKLQESLSESEPTAFDA
ncbi:MAG: FliH/SctL family protein [Pseudomonadales bacterium]|nr:hypothetical protein [Pseudomonadales bacterium]